MHNFKKLTIWSDSLQLSVLVYKYTSQFPETEKFGLISQMRRASVSIASNIAEGSGRSSDKDFCRFLDMAISSSFELETQVEISKEMNFLNEEDYWLIIENCSLVQKKIYAFRKNILNSIQEKS
jgi:four helix bundle protein